MKETKANRGRLLRAKGASLLVVAVMLLTGCSKKVYVPVERVSERIDTVRVEALRIDSVVDKDTVVIAVSGDTVTKTIIKWRYRAQASLLRSEEKSVARDTIPVIREVAKEVRKPLRWWEKALMAMGIAGVAIAGVRVWRLIKK